MHARCLQGLPNICFPAQDGHLPYIHRRPLARNGNHARACEFLERKLTLSPIKFLLKGANLVVDVMLVVASIVWAVVTVVYGVKPLLTALQSPSSHWLSFQVRRENFNVMLAFFAFSFVEPIYIIVKYIVASATQPELYEQDEVPPVIVFGKSVSSVQEFYLLTTF